MVLSGNAISIGGYTTINPGGYYQGFESWCYDSGEYATGYGYDAIGTAQISFSDFPVVYTATGRIWPKGYVPPIQISDLYGVSYSNTIYSASTGGTPSSLSGPVGLYIQLPGGVGNSNALIPSASAWTVWGYDDNSAAHGGSTAYITSVVLDNMNMMPSAANNWSVRYTLLSSTYTYTFSGTSGSTISAGTITENPASANGSWYNLGSSNYLFYAITGNAHAASGGTVTASYIYQFQLDFALTSNTDHIIATGHFTANNNYTTSGAVGKSDIRLKRDITLLDTLYNGIKIYKFRYLWSDVEYVGVMAQDLLDSEYSSAVIKNSDGYYSVDYSQLGFNMTTYDDGTRAVALGHVYGGIWE
jgi:hypothetical protein